MVKHEDTVYGAITERARDLLARLEDFFAQMDDRDKVRTLDEHNERMHKFYNQAYSIDGPRLAGVICPQCKKNGKDVEMVDSGIRGAVTASIPPLKAVKCPECEHGGWKVV